MDSTSSLKRLPLSTVKLLSSSQVITSVSSVVKELMENALDAGASSIEIFLYGHGLDKIVVRDNGRGIKESEVQVMCQRSYTSKIVDFSDLEKLSTYGFRGEALFSLCAVADVSVATVHPDDSYAKTYQMNNSGLVVETKPTSLDKGTIITVTNLFKNLPVRKQFLTMGKRRADELKKVESVVKSLALINCEVKIRLSHDKFSIWQKASVCTVMRSFIQVLPPSIVKQMHEIHHEDPNDKIKITLLVPKMDCNIVSTCLGHSLDAMFLFVNSRPVCEKQIEKVVHDKVFEFFASKIPPRKYPAMLASIVLPPDMIDVNLEPNKTKVLIKDIEKVTKLLRDQLSLYYYGMDEDTIVREACNMEPPKRKIADPISSPKCKKPKKTDSEDSCCDGEEIQSSRQLEFDGKYSCSGGSQIFSSEERAGSCSIFEPLSVSTPLEPEGSIEVTSNSELEKHATISAFLEGLECKPLPSPGASFAEETSTTSPMDVSSKPIVAEDPFELLMTRKTPEKHSEHFIGSQFFSPELDRPGHWEQSNNYSSAKTIENEVEGGVPPTGGSDETAVSEMLSLSCWSRGDVHVNGKQLEGTIAIGRLASTDDPSVAKSQSSAEASDRSVSSQMGQKDMSAFTKFARQMRVEIVKAQPGISFPKIAKELTKRWQELQEEDKQTYKELALSEKLEKKNKVVPKASPSKQSSSEDLRARFLKRYPCVAKVPASLSEIRVAIKNRNAADFDEDTPEIVANINEDLCLVKEKTCVSVFSCSRLQEAIKFHNNLNKMSVDVKSLENGIVINSHDLGALWSVLDRLPSSVGINLEANHPFNTNIVSDVRITKNGLSIEKEVSCSTESKYTITSVAKNLPDFGLDELREILQGIDKDENCRLQGCRPFSVVELIRNETLKSLSSQEFTRTDYILDLFKYWRKKIREYNQHCPHDKSVSQVIYPV